MIRFANVEVWPEQRKLCIGGQSAPLGGRAFDMLLALIERRDRVVSRSELYELVWPGRVVEENNLAVQVLALRKLLGANAVATVPGRGYRFTLAVDQDGPSPIRPLTEPEMVRALPPAGLPPLSPPSPPPKMLGREEDLMALNELLEQHRLVTVIGAGGIGKTTLGLVAAHARRAAHRDGVAWVDLSPISQPALLVPTLTQALQLPATRVERSLQALVAGLQTMQLLLVLDNVEYLAGDVGHLVDALATGAPAVRVLVTSQVPLKVADEHLLRLGPLAVPRADTPRDDAIKYGAVALFVDQAQAAQRHFNLTDENVSTVIELCRQLDGVPLVIKLAAARIVLLGLRGLEQRLADRLRLLGGGGRNVPSRQQTLRAALDWSYGLLAQPEQAAFRAFGVFSGGFTLELASSVASADAQDQWSTIDDIAALVDRSLVSVDGGDPPRYRLLESARDYALTLLDEAGETHRFRARHAQVMLAWCERAHVESQSLTDDEIIDRYGRDVDNLRAAIDWSVAHDSDLAIGLVGASHRIFMTLNLSHETRRRCELLEEAVTNHPDRARAARFWLAWSASEVNSNMAMRTHALRAVALLRETGDAMDLHCALCSIGFSAFVGTEEAARAMVEATALEGQQWPPRLRARRLMAHGNLRMANGELALWRDSHSQAAALAESDGARFLAALASGAAALADVALGEKERALAATRALLAKEQVRRGGLIAFAWGTHARSLTAHGDIGEARMAWEKFFAHNRATDWDRIEEFCSGFYAFAAAEKRCAAAARLRGFWLESFVHRGYSRQVTERFAQSGDTRLRVLRPHLDDATIERLGVEGRGLDAEAVCALTMDTDDRPP